MKKLLLVGVLLCVAFMTGCSGMLRKPEPPSVTLSDIQLQDMTLFEQRYQLQLRVQNPNDFDLPIEGLKCTLYINEREFATGVGASEVTVPRFGEALVAVNVVSNLQSVLEQFRSVGDLAAKPVGYRLIGKLSVGGYPSALPFEYEGNLDLGKLP